MTNHFLYFFPLHTPPVVSNHSVLQINTLCNDQTMNHEGESLLSIFGNILSHLGYGISEHKAKTRQLELLSFPEDVSPLIQMTSSLFFFYRLLKTAQTEDEIRLFESETFNGVVCFSWICTRRWTLQPVRFICVLAIFSENLLGDYKNLPCIDLCLGVCVEVHTSLNKSPPEMKAWSAIKSRCASGVFLTQFVKCSGHQALI